ncbi:Rossmann-like domain-containing protein [Ramlibacter sp.]|uniref:Rossmann-like domain-containing protein n=1 Tax=Ramlibacter sp. TaxID=1917967 RepID=UPI002CCD5558|nr:DUF364 domain-containing protein [Ramlibacter sp.]HWI84682.1 DUF364 domain-containing protein [Ramlibacter sp.]
MDVAHELLALLERVAARTALPRVRGLLLPPAAAPSSIAGEFCAIELDDGSLGLSYVLLDESTRRLVAERGDASLGLAGADALAVARWFGEQPGARRALGFAAINALTRCLFDRAGFVPGPSGDSIGMLAPRPGDHIGMIGLFPPLVRPIVQAGARLTVVELRSELAGEGEGYRVTTDRHALATCSKVIATSTLLLNGTLDAMLAACSGARSFALIGPGAGCLPDPLFARGVTLVGGTWITDPGGFRAALAAGTPWTAAARKTAIRRDDYPGMGALLARL